MAHTSFEMLLQNQAAPHPFPGASAAKRTKTIWPPWSAWRPCLHVRIHQRWGAGYSVRGGRASPARQLHDHNIPVHGAWLNVFFALHCAICTALGCSANCVLSVPYINIALHVRATYYSRENGILQ